jgi:hypothetical protein
MTKLRIVSLIAALLSGASLMASGGGGQTTRVESGPAPATVGATVFEFTSALPASLHKGGEFRLGLQAETEGMSSVRLLDAQGRLVREVLVALDEGANLLNIHLGDLSKGVYFLDVSSGEVHRTSAIEVR